MQERIFVIYVSDPVLSWIFNYQVNIFALCRTKMFAAALWSNLNAMVEKRLP